MSKHGAALIEEYIDGLECTVLVVENPDDPAAANHLYAGAVHLPRGRALQAFRHEVGGLRGYVDQACRGPSVRRAFAR